MDRAPLLAAVTLALLVAPAAAAGPLPGVGPHAAAPAFLPSPTGQPGSALAPAVHPAVAAPAPLLAPLHPHGPGHLRLAPAPMPQALALDDDAPQQMGFVCPQGDPLNQPANTDAMDRTVLGCPIRVYDTTNPFGNPHIAVYPDDPRQLAFFSLHGQATQDGPHGYSRIGGTHTTFTSANQGLSWSDQPTGPRAGEGRTYGETATGAMDLMGNLYVGYLFSHDGGGADGDRTQYGGHIELYKAGPASDDFAVAAAYQEGAVSIDARTPRNPIPAIHLAHVPAAKPLVPDASPPANLSALPGRDGEAAVPEHPNADERVVLTWFERAADPQNSSTGMAGWVEAAFTGTGADGNWTRMRDDQLIGPCKAGSNPAVHGGKVYVACVVEAGYRHRSRARVGDIDVWRIDPRTGDGRLVAFTGLRGGQPILAANPDGYMVLVTVDGKSAAGGRVEAAFGWHGRQWSPGTDLGPELHRLAGSATALDLSVNALALSEDEKTAVLLYKERQPPTQGRAPPTLDPLNPPDPDALADVRLTDYRKIALTFNACDGAIAAAAFGLGTGLDAYQIENYLDNPEVYNDVQDGLAWVRDPVGGGETFHFAVNDYGAMQVGGIQVSSASSVCVVPPAIPSVPVPPVPQALSVANPSGLLAGTVVGSAALAMVGYLLTARRRTAVTAAARQK